ncbi:MAG: InlB B-repeat-containing protein, partial [Shewanella sp.]
GWYQNAETTGNAWDFASDKVPARNQTLYAKWNINQYTASFDLNGGTSAALDDQIIDFGATLAEPATPTRDNYEFVGWNTAADGSGTTWNFTSNTMPAEAITLYAIWDASSYNVHFNTNSGVGVIPAQTIKHGFKISAPSTNPTKVGYTFVSWNTKADGTGTTWDFENDLMPTNELTLYAIYSTNKYVTTFNLNGGTSVIPQAQTVDYNSTLTEPEIPTKNGYIFIEWNTESDGSGTAWNFNTSLMPANDQTLYAQWTKNNYQVTFDIQGGDSSVPQVQTIDFDSKVTEPAVPTKEGSTFVSWNTAADGSGTTWNFATDKMPANNITLYAQWSINKYTVSYNINGGDSQKPENQTIDFDSKVVEPAVPTKVGSTFVSWNTQADGKGKIWNFATDKMPANNITLYAQWSINKYTVSFNVNSGDS